MKSPSAARLAGVILWLLLTAALIFTLFTLFLALQVEENADYQAYLAALPAGQKPEPEASPWGFGYVLRTLLILGCDLPALISAVTGLIISSKRRGDSVWRVGQVGFGVLTALIPLSLAVWLLLPRLC